MQGGSDQLVVLCLDMEAMMSSAVAHPMVESVSRCLFSYLPHIRYLFLVLIKSRAITCAFAQFRVQRDK
jgi:hypothetical protein